MIKNQNKYLLNKKLKVLKFAKIISCRKWF